MANYITKIASYPSLRDNICCIYFFLFLARQIGEQYLSYDTQQHWGHQEKYGYDRSHLAQKLFHFFVLGEK